LTSTRPAIPTKTLGFIVNPVAGMGGAVGLKGTDGKEILQQALKLGAKPIAAQRADTFLTELLTAKEHLQLVVGAGEMGESEATKLGYKCRVIGQAKAETTSEDTQAIARRILEVGVDLLVYCGGDGTTRDIQKPIDRKAPVLGVPTGVKMHSALFAISPQAAARVTIQYLWGHLPVREAEVMDIDEDAFRKKNKVVARLYGYLQVPYEKSLVQPIKIGSSTTMDEKSNQEAIAEYIVERMEDDCYYILCPGTTVKAIADKLGFKKTLLGVDIVKKRRMIVMDVNEEKLLKLIEGEKAKIVVSPIGGQGFIFGRGNQQISPQVIKKVGIDNIIILATENKLHSIGPGKPLLVDTGDDEINKQLSGYKRVVTGYNKEVIWKVSA